MFQRNLLIARTSIFLKLHAVGRGVVGGLASKSGGGSFDAGMQDGILVATTNVWGAVIYDAIITGGRTAITWYSRYRAAKSAAEALRTSEGEQLTIEEMAQAAAAEGRGGLTAAGRALQKHGNRDGSAFPSAEGSPVAINQQAQGRKNNRGIPE